MNLRDLLGITDQEIRRHVDYLHNECFLDYGVADGGQCTSDLTQDGQKLCENPFDLFEEFSVMHPYESEEVHSPSSDSYYVATSRIEELKGIDNPNYDLTKLIQLCSEINIARNFDCRLSIAMILRAIIDHVPPIFGVNSFSEVANNYKNGKSFKELMIRLDTSSRKIADSHLHNQIRKRESLPTFNQVNFAAELDVLLAEIIKTLK